VKRSVDRSGIRRDFPENRAPHPTIAGGVGEAMTGTTMTNAVLVVLQFMAVSQEARVRVVFAVGAGLSGQQE
jgi:hypothetical protein